MQRADTDYAPRNDPATVNQRNSEQPLWRTAISEDLSGQHDSVRPPQAKQSVGEITRVKQVAVDTNLLIAPPPASRPPYQVPDRYSTHAIVASSPLPVKTPVIDSTSKVKIPTLLACFICALFVATICIFGMLFVLQDEEPSAIMLHSPLPPPPTATAEPTATPAQLVIFVSGAVRSVGVYELPIGSRIEDAILRAGGLLPDADAERVNRAQKLFDAAQVHIPRRTATASLENPAALPVDSSSPPIGLSGTDAPSQTVPNAGSSGKIDINRASQSEIESLPGIGADRAQEIIAGRPYSSVSELQKINGIGAKTVEKLSELVQVE